MPSHVARLGASALVVLLLLGSPAAARAPESALEAMPAGDPTGTAKPLAGRLVVIDPGHQLGNHNFPRQINRLVPAGGIRKPCNTTGTATNGGYPEATMVWQVSLALAHRLRDLGARVTLTRTTNRQD